MFIKEYTADKIFMGRLSHGGDLLEQVQAIASVNSVKTAAVSIIGAVKNVKLGYYIQAEKRYIEIPYLDENAPYEIVSCTGNISCKEGKPAAHIHLIVSDREGRTFGGHLLSGTKVFAGEISIFSLTGPDLNRTFDEETGLPLWERE